MDQALQDAAQALLSPIGTVRDQGEQTLLAAKKKALPALVHVLETAPLSDEVRVGRVALLLGAFRARDALLSLLERATSDKTHADDRPLVARAICEIVDGRDAFDDRVLDALDAMGKSPDRFVRAFAAKAYGALGDARSRARVEAFVDDQDAWVREQAELVLRDLRQLSAADEPEQDFASLVAAANAAGGALKPWLDDLNDARRPVREAAIGALCQAGREAVPHLLDKLNQPHTRARISAAQALGQIQATEAASTLLIAATAPAQSPLERELRPVALRALANCLTGLEDGVCDALLPLARDDDRFVRAAALLCLGRLADRRGMRAVVAALTENDPFVIESAAIALSEGVREEDVELVPALLDAFDKKPQKGMSALREAILIALSRIEITAEPLRVRVRHRVRHEILGPTAALRKAALALLERLFADDDPPPVKVIDLALSRLFDDHPEVRVVAASLLARHLEPGFTAAVPLLTRAIGRGERTVSLLCVEALARHDTIAAKKALEELTTSGDSAVALRAAELVESLSPKTEEWRFVSKPRVEAPPRRAISQAPRTPRRVKAVTDEPAGAVVTASFGPEPATPEPAPHTLRDEYKAQSPAPAAEGAAPKNPPGDDDGEDDGSSVTPRFVD